MMMRDVLAKDFCKPGMPGMPNASHAADKAVSQVWVPILESVYFGTAAASLSPDNAGGERGEEVT